VKDNVKNQSVYKRYTYLKIMYATKRRSRQKKIQWTKHYYCYQTVSA
jgi:hypothetical protein